MKKPTLEERLMAKAELHSFAACCDFNKLTKKQCERISELYYTMFPHLRKNEHTHSTKQKKNLR